MGNQEPGGQIEPLDIPPASGGNPPTTAPYNIAYENMSQPAGTPTPNYGGGIPSNPWASPTPMPGGPGGPPSLSISGGGPYSPYDPTYAYGGAGGDPFAGSVAGGDTGNPSQPNDSGGMAFAGTNSGIPGYPDSAPAQSVYPIDWGSDSGPIYGDTKKKTTFMQDLGADVGDIFGALGHAFDPGVGYYSPAYLASIGYTPGGGTGSLFPGSNTFAGGAFWSPPGGSIGGPLGQGSYVPGQGPPELGSYFANQSFARLKKGGDPTLGFGMTGQNNASKMLPVSQWGGLNASNASLYSDQGYTPPGTAGITSGGGPGGMA